MKKIFTLMLLVAVSASLIGAESVAAATPSAALKQVSKPVSAKKQVGKITAGKVKLAKDPKPSAAEIRMARKQAVMEKNYGRYIKGLVAAKNKKKTVRKKANKKKTVKK